jgi:hypothetical protein
MFLTLSTVSACEDSMVRYSAKYNNAINKLAQQDTTDQVPISCRGALLSTLLHGSLILTSHNRPSTYQLQRSATEHSSTCRS